MAEVNATFERGALRSMHCLRGGWDLIKGKYWLFFGITIVGLLIAEFVPMFIAAGPAMCGIYLCLLRRERGKEVRFEHLMRGFDYFLPSLVATLIMVVPVLAVVFSVEAVYILVIAVQAANQPKGAPPSNAFFITLIVGAAIMALLVLIISNVVSALFMFAYPLIVDRRMTGIQALKTSVRAVWGNLAGVVSLMLLIVVVETLGMLACYVGFFFVYPVHMAAIAIAYRQVFPFIANPEQAIIAPEKDPNVQDYDELT
jgi:uncharacterized membrane protein